MIKCFQRVIILRITKDWKDYEILDMASGMKLERWGNYILNRPDPQIAWLDKSFPEAWKKTDAKYIALETELDELRKKRDDILSGQKNDEYLDLMLFVANPSIASPFAESFGLHNFTRYK